MARVRRFKKSRGVVTVEMAITLPLLLLLCMGVIEYGWMFFKVQGITNTTRQAARVGARYGATTAEVAQAVADGMNAAGLGGAGYTVSIVPPDVESVTPGEMLEVSISVPYAEVGLLGSALFPTPTALSATITMAKEGV